MPFPGPCPGLQSCASGTCSSVTVAVFHTLGGCGARVENASCCPFPRSENNLPRGVGAAEVHVGNSGEAEGLSGPV